MVGLTAAVPNETVHAGAVPKAWPKFITHDVSVPDPAVIVPKLSDPATEGDIPQAEIVGVVELANI